MRKTVLTLSLSLILAACADHSGTIASIADGPSAPINQPDNHVVDPGTSTPSTNSPSESEPGSGPSSPGGSNPGGGNPPGGGTEGGGGSPVPEPGTLLLVGTGLAGAALLRRRRQALQQDGQS